MEDNKTMSKTAYEKPCMAVMKWAELDVLTISEMGTQWQETWDEFFA